MKSFEALTQSRCRDYLVPFLRDVLEAERLMEAEDSLAARFIAALKNLLKDAYIETAGHKTISEWEKIFDLTLNATLPLPDRRATIIERLSTSPILNEAWFIKKIAELFGGIPHSVNMDCKTLVLRILTENYMLQTDGEFELVVTVAGGIAKIAPCNIKILAVTQSDVDSTNYIGAGLMASIYTRITIGE